PLLFHEVHQLAQPINQQRLDIKRFQIDAPGRAVGCICDRPRRHDHPARRVRKQLVQRRTAHAEREVRRVLDFLKGRVRHPPRHSTSSAPSRPAVTSPMLQPCTPRASRSRNSAASLSAATASNSPPEVCGSKSSSCVVWSTPAPNVTHGSKY